MKNKNKMIQQLKPQVRSEGAQKYNGKHHQN